MAAKKKATKKPAAKRPAAKKSAVKAKASPFMRIGDKSPAGEFMGIARGVAGQPDYYLYRGPTSPEKLNHAAALAYAKACKEGGHKDWQLPDRTDGALLYANGREQMQGVWHWLKPQYAHDDDYAWCQDFAYGIQLNTTKNHEFAVVLVRRVPIQ